MIFKTSSQSRVFKQALIKNYFNNSKKYNHVPIFTAERPSGALIIFFGN
jgi:hypothetical protein